MDGKHRFASRVVCMVSSCCSCSSRHAVKKNDEDKEKGPELPCSSRDKLDWWDHEPCV